ncbi:Cell surface protein [Methanosarcina horonobensis HB-1 = JCM 15518]|uniref:Cell surface protein n=1 Tax=Methanosarcina horonobensis HB-1 = JCM 15518 TaxID=1434110 RepID=A0A0E3SAG6_9EURY|nr:lectin like domain-containing protein [Methanosarcina horonobensis]AKB77791.1 Cell surface protein [Methanosarcina horonobensis HB-1 = JCM 15518]
MKKRNSLLLSLIVIFSCLSVSPNPVVGSAENFEPPLNNSSLSEPEIEIAPLNPEFLDPEQPDSVEPISSSDYGHISGPGYTPPPVNISAVSTPATRLLLRASGSELPSTYDLRTEGRVTPVKNQGQTGSCWAFSSIASLESYILGTEGESRDFSENNMKNLVTKNYPDGFDLTDDDGGNSLMAMAYLTRWSGPVNETDDPYSDTLEYSPLGLPLQKHVQEVLVLPKRTGSLDNEVIKRALMDYGAVFSTICWNSVDFQDKNDTYRYTGSSSANHAITIVGWNDSFDRNRFKQVPSGDGAFIVKNSWGESWGDGGYFYISYYDTRFGYGENTVFTASEEDNFDYNYQYDPLGWINEIGYPENLIAWGSNVFSSERNEKLEAVGFYTTDLNTVYEIYVYKNPTNGPVNSAEGFVVKESGTCSYRGYHTHLLNSTVNLTSGEKFSVVIKFRNPSYTYPLAIENQKLGYSSQAQADSGESYVSLDGTSWQDLTTESGFSEANLCIKAFTTVNELPEADFSSNITSYASPLTVQFTGLSTGAFSWEWDFNGDGITDSTVQNPVYTYTSHGNYTVSLNVSNRIGSDSETKSHYITVTPLSILSANPGGSVGTYEGDLQEFNISTNHNTTVNWYLNGTKKLTESNVKHSSYSNSAPSPGTYNVTVLAAAGSEKVTHTWNWTVLDWNPWDNSTSQEGKNISTEELQEAIHIYKNSLPVPETEVEMTGERLMQLIRLWREGSAN